MFLVRECQSAASVIGQRAAELRAFSHCSCSRNVYCSLLLLDACVWVELLFECVQLHTVRVACFNFFAMLVSALGFSMVVAFYVSRARGMFALIVDQAFPGFG